MAAEWRLLYAGAVSGDVLGELPFLQASFSEQLNGVGSWSATIPFDEPDTVYVPDGAGGVEAIDRSGVVVFDGVRPAKTVVHLERGGVIIASGIVWTVDLDYEAGTMQIAGGGLGSYYTRVLNPPSPPPGTDQGSIAWGVLDTVNVAGTLNCIPQIITTGVLRDRTYRPREGTSVLDVLEGLSNVENGMDFRFRCQRNSSGNIVRRVLFDFPQIGRLTSYTFEVGVNCALLSYSEDGSGMTNSVAAVGAGEGIDQLYVTGSGPLEPELPNLQSFISRTDISNQATLLEHVNFRLLRGRVPIRRVTLTLAPGSEPEIGTFDVGDRVRVRVRKGWLDIADVFRVVEIAYDVSDTGEQTRVVLAGLESFEM